MDVLRGVFDGRLQHARVRGGFRSLAVHRTNDLRGIRSALFDRALLLEHERFPDEANVTAQVCDELACAPLRAALLEALVVEKPVDLAVDERRLRLRCARIQIHAHAFL